VNRRERCTREPTGDDVHGLSPNVRYAGHEEDSDEGVAMRPGFSALCDDAQRWMLERPTPPPDGPARLEEPAQPVPTVSSAAVIWGTRSRR
jgi:hypothetical protein